MLDKKVRAVLLSGSILTVDSLGFMGPYALSPKQQFAIGWDDKTGAFVLARGSEVAVSGRMQSPALGLGAVADCGVFALVSGTPGGFAADTLNVFDATGKRLVTQRFDLNVFIVAVAVEGDFVACQLADGDVVLLDVRSAGVSWRKPANSATGLRLLAVGLAMPPGANCVELDLGLGRCFRIGLNGDYLDADELLPALVEAAKRSPNGLSLFYLVRERLDRLDGRAADSDVQELMGLLQAAQRLGFRDYPSVEAAAFRAMGELSELVGNSAAALADYETALRLNAKVGVKRRIDPLKRGT